MGRKVIIDCDPGIDDSLALMLALSVEELEVAGITIVCGNAPVEMGFENAKKVLKHMGRLDVPVFVGAEKPLKREYVNALDTHGADGLGESFLEPVPGYRQPQSAVEFMAGTLIRGDCSVIALGPLTNLARLIETDREAFDRIQELVSMGGNFRSHGNCSPVAEYNYWADPDAAALVYRTLAENGEASRENCGSGDTREASRENCGSGDTREASRENCGPGDTREASRENCGPGVTGEASRENCGPGVTLPASRKGAAAPPVLPDRLTRIHMIGLDVTRKIVLTPDLLEYLDRLDHFHGDFVRKITRFYYDFHWEWEHLVGCVINDPLAVAYFADRSLCRGFEAYVDVETGGISLGQTVVDSMNFYRRQPNAVVLTETDAKAFFYTFFGKLLNKERTHLELLEHMCRM